MSAQTTTRDAGAPPPSVTRPMDALLRVIGDRFAVLACATPTNAVSEQTRLFADWSLGRETMPRWVAPTIDRASLGAARRDVDRALGACSRSSDAWIDAYAARFEEVARELELIDAVFGSAVISAARRRFAVAPDEMHEADAIAQRWIVRDDTASDGALDEPLVLTDDERDARSLLQQMRRAIARHGVAARVVVRDRIGALAAAGDGVVVVAKGRRATEREAARVVLHEIEGHVLPRERGRAHAPGLRTLGSAGASEDEEGRALLLEERAGLLDGKRRRTVAARHLAASLVERGGCYRDVVRALRDVHALSVEEALAVASRVMRGAFERASDVAGGVMRERIYLPAYVRVKRAVAHGEMPLDRLGDARLSIVTRRLLRSP